MALDRTAFRRFFLDLARPDAGAEMSGHRAGQAESRPGRIDASYGAASR